MLIAEAKIDPSILEVEVLTRDQAIEIRAMLAANFRWESEPMDPTDRGYWPNGSHVWGGTHLNLTGVLDPKVRTETHEWDVEWLIEGLLRSFAEEMGLMNAQLETEFEWDETELVVSVWPM